MGAKAALALLFINARNLFFFFSSRTYIPQNSSPNTPTTTNPTITTKMSSTLSYAHAKVILTEVEKDRIVCTYLNSTEPNAVSLPIHFRVHSFQSLTDLSLAKIDWDKAASEYGAASVESYKKGMQNTTKKIKKSMDSGVEPEAVEGSAVKKSGGKKRKEKTVEADGEVEGETEESPTKKKKGGKKTKAQKAAEAAAAAENDEEGDVKAEVDEE
jgi:uncharacterized protein YunC (DUF1805 family)